MWFSAVDFMAAMIACVSWLLVVDPAGTGLSRDSLAAVGTVPWALSILGISK